MGMPGMSTNDTVAYAQSEKSAPVSVSVPTANVSKMTVAELRNYVNPTTKYYDNWSAKDFIESESVPNYDKICALFGKAMVKTRDLDNNMKINATLNILKKVVA